MTHGEEGPRPADPFASGDTLDENVTAEIFRCMACGHEYQEEVRRGEDRERSCPKCRSNSIRHLKAKASPGAGA